MGQFEDMRNQSFSSMGRGSRLRGIFQFFGSTFVNGELEGDITVADNAIIIIERTGIIEGKINCKNIDIYGTFKGIVNAKDQITVYPTARVSGDLNCSNLKIHPGAILNIEGNSDPQKGKIKN